MTAKKPVAKAKAAPKPATTKNGTQDAPLFETTEQEAPRAQEQKEAAAPDVLIRKAEKADIQATKPKVAMPVPGPKEKIFECPQGCLKIGPSDRNEDWCSTHGIKINAHR